MKIKSVASSLSLALLFCQTSFAASTFFNVSASGTVLTITTNVPNHTYPSAGIRINSPSNFSARSGCTQQSNGFCTFSVSNSTPAIIGINGSTATMNITLCLNGLGPLSCQDYNVSMNGPVLYASTKYGVVEVSTNRGATWTPTSQPGGNTGNGLWMYNNVIYMGSPSGNVEKSTNNGTSWSATGAQPDGSTVLSVFANNGTLYAGTANGNLAISTNGGSTWSLTTPPAPISAQINAPVAGIYVSDNTIYVATNNGGDPAYNYVKMSTNGGSTWRDISPSPPPGGSLYYTTVFLANNTLYTATNDAKVYTTTLPLPPTSPTWTLHDSGTVYGLHALYVQAGTPNNTLYSAGDSNIPISTDNGGNWNTDLSVPDSIGSYGIYLDGNTLYTSTIEGNLLSHNITSAGSDWTSSTQQPGGDLPYGLSIASNGTLYVGGSNGELSFSSNGGQTWTGTSITNTFAQFYATLIQGDVVYAGDLYGDFWKYQNGMLTHIGADSNGAILSLTANGGTFYDGDIAGYVKSSIDGGINWTSLSRPDGNIGVSSLVAISGSSNLYAGLQNGEVEHSSDAGASWNLLSSLGSAVNGLVVDTSTNPYTLYAGIANGNVEISTDGGSTWSATPSKPDSYPVLSLVGR